MRHLKLGINKWFFLRAIGDNTYPFLYYRMLVKDLAARSKYTPYLTGINCIVDIRLWPNIELKQEEIIIKITINRRYRYMYINYYLVYNRLRV